MICYQCKEDKEPRCFYNDKSRPNGKRAICKICANKNNKEWRKKNSIRLKDYDTMRKYGVKASELKDTCELCGSKENLCMDHCHKTGRYRGTLCRTCNSMLGFAKDNIETLHNAIKYLTIYP